MAIFSFLSGILYIYTCNYYLLAVPFSLFFVTLRPAVILLFLLGVTFAWLHNWFVAPQGMPDGKIIPHAIIIGTIASIPTKNVGNTKFNITIEQLNNQPAHGLIQLAWYRNAPQLSEGQRWQLSVKLKRPRNYLNPGSANYAGTLAARHIQWTGYVHSDANQLLAKETSPYNWLHWRQKLGVSLTNRAPNEEVSGILEALTLNLTTHISAQHWDLFRRTGTIHLFGISGEHIALISGFTFVILRWLWSRSAVGCLYYPAISVASIGSVMTAILYAFLAGFEPPVQRALIGCFFYTLYRLGIQRFSPWQIWRYALFGVLCIEPHAVFMQGFYFSFIAVACLLLTHQRWQLKGFKGNLALQLSCLIGLMPLTLHWYAYGSLNGFIANLLAIPLVGFFIVPLALITMVFSSFHWSSLLMIPLAWLVSLLLKILIWTEYLAGINIIWSIHSIIYVLSFMLALLVWVLLPIKPFKYLAFFWILIPFFPYKEVIKSGEVLIQVLDVGQGLSVAVQTKKHVLLYDTGDQFFQGNDLGNLVILPFLNTREIKKIDTIVISHPDNDHQGGLKSVAARIPVDQLLVNNPTFYQQGQNCHQYPEWEWDGVRFQFFPINIRFNDKNNNSCILKISNAVSSILLPGDIEQIAEDYLIQHYGEQLASEILIVPHHGSKTSSSYRFLLETKPRYAIASLGFHNRFRFPHDKTLASMKGLNIPFYRTDQCGMVKIHIPAKGQLAKPECYSGLIISGSA